MKTDTEKLETFLVKTREVLSAQQSPLPRSADIGLGDVASSPTSAESCFLRTLSLAPRSVPRALVLSSGGSFVAHVCDPTAFRASERTTGP